MTSYLAAWHSSDGVNPSHFPRKTPAFSFPECQLWPWKLLEAVRDDSVCYTGSFPSGWRVSVIAQMKNQTAFVLGQLTLGWYKKQTYNTSKQAGPERSHFSGEWSQGHPWSLLSASLITGKDTQRRESSVYTKQPQMLFIRRLGHRAEEISSIKFNTLQ